MACIRSDEVEVRLIAECARLADGLQTEWYAVYMADEVPHVWRATGPLAQNIRLAAGLGATIIRLRPERAVDALAAFARRERVTHIMLEGGATSRWAELWAQSTLDPALPRTAVISVPAQRGLSETVRDGDIEVDLPSGNNRLFASATRVRGVVRWSLLCLAVGLFVLQAPAVVCLAATIILVVLWCRELDF